MHARPYSAHSFLGSIDRGLGIPKTQCRNALAIPV